MNLAGRTVLVLGGAGLVGTAVCRALIAENPARVVVAARREARATAAVARLREEGAAVGVELAPAWGDVFIRAAWQADGPVPRAELLDDPERRRRLVDDILGELDEDIVRSSTLVRLVAGPPPADVVVDCMNTATATSYQNVYGEAARLRALAADRASDTCWDEAVDRLLATLYVPQLVRHVQLLYEGMRRAGSSAYVKVGTTGTGGFGLNIPYTHGEEKPSRLLLAKSAMAGAQTMLTFLLARTPDAPPLVKHVTPAACIGWREIGHGPIRLHGRPLERWDCPVERAVSAASAASRAPEGDFGVPVGAPLEGVFIDTGENGLFSADEFLAITAPGQMQLVTAEEIALNVVRELRGAATGRELVSALDATVMGPTHRGGALRTAALERLRALEAEHGPGVAFEILGPPALSKLLFEAELIGRCGRTRSALLAKAPATLAAGAERAILADADLRQRALSVGIPILLGDGERLLRGPIIKTDRAEQGWIDLREENMVRWQARIAAMCEQVGAERDVRESSRFERCVASGEGPGDGPLVPGEAAAWILDHEEGGRREKT